MQGQEEARRPREEAEAGEDAERRRRPNPYLKYIFGKPELEVVEGGEARIPIRSVVLEAKPLIMAEEVTVVQEAVSKAHRVLVETYHGEPVEKPALPRWTDWRETENSVIIKDVLDVVIDEFRPYLGEDARYDFFTTSYYLHKPFRVSRRLVDAMNSKDRVRSAAFKNEDGGIDIFAEVESFTQRGVKYHLLVSVNKEGIRTFCSCPTGHLVCKHQIAVLASHIPQVFGTLIGIKSGDAGRGVEEFKGRHKAAVERLLDLERRGYAYVWEAYIYYFVKMLRKPGIVRPVKVPGWAKEEVAKLIGRVFEDGELPPELSTIATVEVKKARPAPARKALIVWTDEMREAREKILALIRDLQVRFGRRAGESEWAEMLAFALVASADYTRPPVTLHVLGDIGTFKTTGARLAAQYVYAQELVITGKGDPRAAYEKVLEALSRYFGIIPSEVYNKIGGVVTAVSVKGGTVEVGVSIPFLFSLLSARGGSLKDYVAFKRALREEGFELKIRRRGMTVDVKDPIQLPKIEHYRFSYVPDKALGLLTKAEVFDNYVLVIDEGSRNPDALEGMLTKMTVSTVNEGVRIIIVTDNWEPHIEMARNPRYAPLYDRMFMATTSGVMDELTAMENLHKKPAVMLDMVTLLAIHKFVEAIPVPEEAIYLIKSVANALAYKFTKLYSKGGDKFLKPIRRSERAGIELDVLSGAPQFDFAPGNRFTVHTIQLAKFKAFLGMDREVTYKHIAEALYSTISGRLILDARTLSEHKVAAAEVVNTVISKIPAMRDAMARVAELVAALGNREYDKAAAIFNDIVDELDDKPELTPVLMSGLELFMALREFNIDELPRPIAYTIAEIALIKGDMRMLEGTRTLSELIEIERGAREGAG